MAHLSHDPKMKSILTRMKMRGVDVRDTTAMILALEEEIDTYRKTIQIMRDQLEANSDRPCIHSKDCEDGCTGYQAGYRSGYSDGFEQGVLMIAHRAISELTPQRSWTDWELVMTTICASLDVRKEGVDG